MLIGSSVGTFVSHLTDSEVITHVVASFKLITYSRVKANHAFHAQRLMHGYYTLMLRFALTQLKNSPIECVISSADG